ncbi:hypothetical protein HD554DRAFT_2202408 [Boletus coccyginus]|nr:hypothetical protein HD554DRAFT_2202408 [Boletus coccyginus]
MIQTCGDLNPIESNTPDGPLANDTDLEELELWMRDPVACVQELIGNPVFDDSMAYTPEKVYVDQGEHMHRYDKMWTGDWWWQTQECLSSGATITPVIIALDKIHLFHFKGDKTAWPVYLSIGNLSKQHGTILLGYLPVSKLTSFEDNSTTSYQLFHYCMRQLLQPLMMFFPILATYIGDHPKQCLVACCTKNHCPKCIEFALCNQTQTKQTLHMQATGQYPLSFIAEGLQPVFSSFWTDFPHTNIFICISSDILHQLHQGLFKDYLKKWCATIAGSDDFDAWFHAMPIFPGLRHFNNGILQIRQWTGTDHNLTDFICLAQYQSHMDETIQALSQALDDFHGAKDVFIELDLHEHFNIPKVHSLLHYIDTIKNVGSLDGVNTESLECLHIDYVKKAYAASSRKDYMIQMTKWLQCQEAVIWFNQYLIWHNSTTDITPLTRGSGNDECGPCASSIHALTLAEPIPTHTLYHIALKPHLPKKTVQYLEQYHGAVSFLPALKDFLGTINGEHQFCALTIHDHFDVFTNLVLLLPPNEHAPSKDHSRICVHPLHLNGTHKPPTLARFDMVLTTDCVDLSDREILHSLRMAEVWIFFTLPSHLGTYSMQIHSTRQQIPNTEVIPVDQIVQQCHLIPSFSRGAVNSQWIQGHVLAEAQYFYLNRYIDLRTFEQYSHKPFFLMNNDRARLDTHAGVKRKLPVNMDGGNNNEQSDHGPGDRLSTSERKAVQDVPMIRMVLLHPGVNTKMRRLMQSPPQKLRCVVSENEDEDEGNKSE